MISTLKIDAMGCLHIWKGNVIPQGYKYTWTAAGKWADVYVQSEDDVLNVIENLTEDERDVLQKGYHINTTNIPSEYLINE
jgi:hypothetical protein